MYRSLTKIVIPIRFSRGVNPRSLLFSTSSFDATVGQHLKDLQKRYGELEQLLSSPSLDTADLAKYGKEMSALGKIISVTNGRSDLVKSIADLDSVEQEELQKGSSADQDIIELAKEEKQELATKLSEVENEIIRILTPKDDADSRSVVLEVRAGTGGDEASLFAGEVFKMYQKYAFLKGWKWEEVSLSRTEIGGFKEAQAIVNGEDVFKHMKFESGVHRVQRIPCNDTKIQTSAASVIVMPEADELDVTIRKEDVRVDVFRSSGAGGQSVQKTESAVRLTHIPTGIVVSMQDERSQIRNRAVAMKYLKAKLYDLERRKSMAARSELRTAAGGTGDRSDKIRTYNFPQDRVSDHRIQMTVAGVERVMNGEALHNLIDGLMESDENDRLKNFLESIKNKRNTY